MRLDRVKLVVTVALFVILACGAAFGAPGIHTGTFSAHVSISGFSGGSGGVASYAAALPSSNFRGVTHHATGFGQFMLGQFVLWALGLGFAGLIGAVFGRAARNVSVNIKRKPITFGLAGGAAVAGLGLLFASSTWLVHLPIGLLFLPLKAAVGGTLLLFLGFGWVCSMATLGANLERTAPTPATWFRNAARGLSLTLGINIIAGILGLGGFALAVQLICALVGCGAAMFSRFGACQLPVQ